MESSPKQTHHSSESYLDEGDEKLPNRQPRFLCQVPNQEKFIYVSSDVTDESAVGWTVYVLDASGKKKTTTKLPVDYYFNDGKGTTVLGTLAGDFVTDPTPDEPAVRWCDESLISHDVADFDIT